MKICPQCKAQFSDDNNFCELDGTDLNAATRSVPTLDYDVDALLGKTVDGRYTLEKCLGRGGMGAVYRARHNKLPKYFAIKVLLPGIASDRLLVDRFKKESIIVAQIKHPNVVAVQDCGETADGLLYMVMDYIEGQSLRSWLDNEKRMTVPQALPLLKQLFAGVSVAHQLGIVHRDLKPENVMLETLHGQTLVRVLDFGIAKLKEDVQLTLHGQILGTPFYMSPEQWQGAPLDQRADIYALGVMIYELLSGALPFYAGSWQAVMQKHLHEIHQPLEAVQGDVPLVVAQAVAKALAKDPAKRQQTIEELWTALEAAAHETATTPTPATTATPSAKGLFISYAAQERAKILPITGALKAHGLQVWGEEERLEGSAMYGVQVVQAIKHCDALLLMCSDAAMRSRAVKQEILLAWKYAKPIVPLLLQRAAFPEQLEYWLEGWHWIEVLNHPQEYWLPKIHQALRYQAQAMDASAVESPPPDVPPQAIEIGKSVGEPRAPLYRGLGALPNPLRPELASTLRNTAKHTAPRALAELIALATFTDQIWTIPGNYEQKATGFRGLGAPQDGVKRGYRIGDALRLAIEADRAGHLLLLNEGADGLTYCLCPSWFAPKTRLKAGRNYYPQTGSQYDAFVLTGAPGREHLLAIITDEPFAFDWMPNDEVPARVLQPTDIEELCHALRRLAAGKWTALSTYFTVTA
ncbi:MAG: protein kinase [Acidobacteria bacterium]|nr:protein kinase [Acidobacteriota bacterium]